ncbi:hypothetical protein HNQ64_000609 [Prosthecobacter dejongeii]|uniref:Uncharacterized protein n=1 Tax=Prosthecobacter dejongeii TaxID=48465 RepID=A0A7W7YI82_9BACT|nr:hypothetical protein [Prosthecobacter dejongeii]
MSGRRLRERQIWQIDAELCVCGYINSPASAVKMTNSRHVVNITYMVDSPRLT